MITAIDVLRLLETFEHLKASPTLPQATKVAISGELLALVPAEIMAPGCKHTSDAVRSVIREFINAAKPLREAQKAGDRSQEGPTREDTVSTAGSEVGRPENTLRRLWKDPEWKAKKLESMKSVKRGRPHGVPDGYRKKTIAPIRERIIEENKLIVRYMVATKQFEPDNNVSEQAFETLLEAIRVPGSLKDRISAAKALLDFTQRKPAAYSEVTLNKAETFLEAVLEEAQRAEGTSGNT